MTSWLTDAADLLAEPDPGLTPWLVKNLIVDGALVAAVGRWKTTKSYGLLDICVAIATGRPAFGALAIPKPGPVLFINEEAMGRFKVLEAFVESGTEPFMVSNESDTEDVVVYAAFVAPAGSPFRVETAVPSCAS